MSDETNLTHDPDGTIPLATAIAWAAKWRTFLAASEPGFAGRSFLIPILSLNTLLANNPTVDGVRAYIGLEDETDPLTAKLILVPVVNGEEVHTLPGGRSATVDLVGACPPNCPTGNGPTLENS